MFGIFKKPLYIKAPVGGEVVDLSSVPDEVFANKLAGDGVAMIPTDGEFLSPIDGIIIKIFDTNHAYIVRSDNGIEVMVHIGLDTVSLNSKGFERIAQQGDTIKAGEVVIKVDLEYIKTNATDIITPIVISDDASYKSLEKFYGEMKPLQNIMEMR